MSNRLIPRITQSVAAAALAACSGGGETPASSVAPTPVASALATQWSTTSATSGEPFAAQPTVYLVTSAQARVARSGVTIVAELASGGGALAGTTSASTDASGAAVFTNLAVNGSGAHTLRFTSPGLAALTSGVVLVAPAPATALKVARQADGALNGFFLTTQPQLQLVDRNGLATSQAGTVVTAALASGSGVLAGSTTATSDANGMATFANLTIAGEGAHTLRFSATGVTDVTSSAVNVGPRPVRSNLLSASFQRTCVRSPSTGAVSCWGIGWGTGGVTPVPVSGGLVFAEFKTSGFRECGRLVDGSVHCQGDNRFGTLGVGNQSSPVSTPTPVVGGLRFAQVAVGDDHSCARTAAGSVHCWGFNTWGQLGDGSTTERLVPTLVSGGRSFVEISAGSLNACGRESGGAAYCWGANVAGQVGDGTTSLQRTAPTAVAGGHSFVEVSVGGSHACGRRSDGSVLCWGRNDFGQLGDGTQTDRLVPTPIASTRTFVELTLGVFSSCARQADGVTFCWGQNAFGQFGNGTLSARGVSTPTLAAEGRAFADISLAGPHACGREADGTVYCWGTNDAGQLGDGTRVQRLTPVRVGRFP
jgi:hypothetical protein